MSNRIYFKDLPGYAETAERQRNYIGKDTYYDLELIKNNEIRNQVTKYVLYRMQKVKLTTFYCEKSSYNNICRFLNDEGKKIKKLQGAEPEFLMRMLKKWMLKNGLSFHFTTQNSIGKEKLVRNKTIGYMESLLEFLNSNIQIPEREKDVWNLKKLDIPFRENLIVNYETVNFTRIIQLPLREEVKSGIYLNLQEESIACVQKELTAMRRLSSYLQEKYPDIHSCEDFNREVLEEYLTYLRTEKTTNKCYHSELNRLRAILENIGKIYGYTQLEEKFLSRDIPPVRKTEFKFYSDAELKRLNVQIVKLNEQYARAMVLHQLLGTRISDTLTLQTDCLYEKNGEILIRIRQMKTHTYEKPVSDEVAALIRQAIRYTRERYGKTTYIFVNDRDVSRPLQYKALQEQVVKMIYKENLRDDEGQLFGFNTHLYRHTYGVKLAEMHLDDWTIARLLGHSSVKNAKYYRKMSAQTLADETRKARDILSKIILENLDGWEEEYEQIRQDGRVE